MRLLKFATPAGPALGVEVRGRVVDLNARGFGFGTWESAITAGAAALAEAAKLAAAGAGEHALAAVRLLAPLRPGKYLAIGMNYRKHAQEAEGLGIETPKRQFWFNKQTTCINGPFDDIDPGVSEQVDYEVELGVVVGRAAKNVAAEHAHEHIFGYVVANDVSARDWQFHSPTFTLGKSFDTHGPIGPWIVTADEITDCHNLDRHPMQLLDLRRPGGCRGWPVCGWPVCRWTICQGHPRRRRSGRRNGLGRGRRGRRGRSRTT